MPKYQSASVVFKTNTVIVTKLRFSKNHFKKFTMGTRFFYKKAKTYNDPIVDQLARQFRKIFKYFGKCLKYINSIYFVFLAERALIISEQQETFIVDSPPESSDREVSPKLVVGTKKYGRRSRPQTQNNAYDLSVSDSEDTNDELDTHSHRSCHTQQVQRSTSQTDIPGTRRRSTTGATETKLKRCASLPAQRNLLNQNKAKLVANKSKFGKDPLSQLTKSTLDSSVESLGKFFDTNLRF